MVEATSMASILDGQTAGGMSISEMLNTQKDELEEFGTTITSKLVDMMRAVTNSPPPTTDAIEMPDIELLRMLEQPLSPLTVLSISAIITTISLFFCGIPICMQIYRRRSTHEISGFPFLMGFLGGAYWLRYGLLKSDLTMVSVNVVGVSLMLLYLLFYLYYSRPRTNFLLQLMMVQSLVAIMLVLVNIFGMDSIKFLGFVCMTFNIVNFGAPLAGMAVVLRNRSCSTLPLPLCTANLLVSSQWCIYGVCMDDIFIIIPNGCGVVLASFQICLFLIFPRTEGTHAPLAKCCPRLLDLEKGDGGLIGDSNSHGRKKSHKRENEYAHHRTLNPRNKFMHRQRVIDRRMIPASRAACIEFLRAGGAFDASFGSVSSRATQDSWMSGAGGNGNSTISRISSSLSHPELFATVQQADEQPCLYLQLGSGGNYGIDSNIGEHSSSNRGQQPASTISIGPSTSLLSTTIGPMTPSFSASGAGLSVSRPAVCQEFGGIQEEILIDENQLLTEERQPEGDLLFIRTLSAPDLLALLNRGGGNGNIGGGQS